MIPQNNLQSLGKEIENIPPHLAKEIHRFMEQNAKQLEKDVEKLKRFIEIQTKLTEFRLFMTLNADKQEIENITKRIREDKRKMWDKLLKKYKGNKEKAMDYFYK